LGGASLFSKRTISIALEQVKGLLLEELGTHTASETHIEDFSLTKDRPFLKPISQAKHSDIQIRRSQA